MPRRFGPAGNPQFAVDRLDIARDRILTEHELRGDFGAIAFGIGTTQIRDVLATQTMGPRTAALLASLACASTRAGNQPVIEALRCPW